MGTSTNPALQLGGVADTADGSHVATVEISGDFPGSPALLGFVFAFDDQERISRLVIAP